MGWTVHFNCNLKSMIRDRIRPWENTKVEGYDRVTGETLKHCFRGAVTHSGRLWSVREVKWWRNGEVVNTVRYIALDLLVYSRQDEGWAYKDIDESCGPYEIDCPLSYLEMTPQPESECAGPWREKVRAYHADRQRRNTLYKRVKVGDNITLRGGIRPHDGRVVELRKMKRGHRIVMSSGGAHFFIRPRDIETVETADAYCAG